MSEDEADGLVDIIGAADGGLVRDNGLFEGQVSKTM